MADEGSGSDPKPRALRLGIPRRSNTGPAPLSLAQKRLWILHQLDKSDPSSNRPLAVRLIGQLDQRALEMSLNEIVRRHEILRTVFPEIDGEPVQVVLPAVPLDLEAGDLGFLPELQRQAEAERIAAQEAQNVFNLERGPLLHAVLLRLEEDQHVLLLLMHHIVFDGWSERILLQELSALYEAFSGKEKRSPLSDLPIQYADFAVWQHVQLTEGDLDKQMSYWKEQLRGLPALVLQSDSPRTNAQNNQGASQSVVLSPSLTEQLKELSRRERVTLFMTLFAAFQVLLSRYTGQEDFAVGVPVAGRTHLETEGLVGCFMNVLVLRAALSGNPGFCEALSKVRQAALEAYAHQAIPFEKLVEELRPERSPNRWPLFQVMFHLRNLPTASVPSDTKLCVEPFPFDSGLIGGLDLSLEVLDERDGLHCVFTYPPALFRADTIDRMARNFRNLLEGVAADPGQRLWNLPLLTESELRQIVTEWNDTRREYPADCIHRLFEKQVERTPTALAAVFHNQQLTYAELNAQSNRLAHYLRKYGVKPDTLVGVCMERSLEMIVALLGVLKAGGAYVPLDPAYPKERLAFMLDDSRPSVVLTQQTLLSQLPVEERPMTEDRRVMMDEEQTSRFSVPRLSSSFAPCAMRSPTVVCLDRDRETIAQESEENHASGVNPDNLAYVIYTSGSTGTPKGVMACHRGVCNYLWWRSEYFPLIQGDRLLQKSSFTFDDSVWEFFEPLICGASLVIAGPEDHQDVSSLIGLIAKHRITAACFVPSMLQLVLDQPDVDGCNRLRRVTTGGEVLSAALQNSFFDRLAADLYNGYGPTEATIGATFWKCDRQGKGGTVPIGRPIANTQIYLRDSYGNPVPIGVAGEIYIGGDSVTRGYLNRPDLTAERFLPDPFSAQPGARLYRTGDLARYRPDGNIEFLGRVDHQVKVRGFRIELEEIESLLAQHPGVTEVAVAMIERTPYDKRLIAYVAASRRELAPGELRDFIKKRAPSYMLPSAFVILDELPHSSSGKIDRQALPFLSAERMEADMGDEAPQSATERALIRLWEEVLGQSPVRVQDNFFDLGGHSLLGTRLISRIRAAFHIDFPLRALFENPTIQDFARLIATQSGDPNDLAGALADLEPLSEEEVEKLLSES